MKTTIFNCHKIQHTYPISTAQPYRKCIESRCSKNQCKKTVSYCCEILQTCISIQHNTVSMNLNHAINIQYRNFNRLHLHYNLCPDSKVHGANMGHIWGLQDPGGPHVGPMNFAIWVAQSLQRRKWTSLFLHLMHLWIQVKCVTCSISRSPLHVYLPWWVTRVASFSHQILGVIIQRKINSEWPMN